MDIYTYLSHLGVHLWPSPFWEEVMKPLEERKIRGERLEEAVEVTLLHTKSKWKFKNLRAICCGQRIPRNARERSVG